MSTTRLDISTGAPMFDNFLVDLVDELEAARAKHTPMNSHHEAYAVILEELDEYWEEVRRQSTARDSVLIYRELVQVATMAARAALDLCLEHQVNR